MTGKTIRWAFMRWTDIPDRNDPTKTYLRRLRIVQTPWFALYLHFIFLPDDDRHLHSHPWRFSSLIVRGSYTEELSLSDPRKSGVFVTEHKTHRTGSLHRMDEGKFHRIRTISENLVTLVFVGKRRCNWGFWTENGYVLWEEYDRGQDIETASM